MTDLIKEVLHEKPDDDSHPRDAPQALHSLAIVLMALFTPTLHGCADHQSQAVTSQPAGNKKFFTCTACLVDDANRCATNTPACGDSTERSDSEVGAKIALCDRLSPGELARRPTPEGFKPNPYTKNACYVWRDDAFKFTCMAFTTTCENVPIH